MSDPDACVRCGGTMERGFVLDNADGGRRVVASWIEGAPETSLWTGLKTKDRAIYEVVTWRCRRCGYLEGYAR